MIIDFKELLESSIILLFLHGRQCYTMKETSGDPTTQKSHKKKSYNDFKILYLIFSDE